MKFSVIIPAYNAEKFIETSINSVLNQTAGCLELIVVDDGSKDATKTVIEKFEDERIRYIYQENGGVASARNTGILAARGEHICFLDSDDWWEPNHLKVITSLIKKYPDCGMFITGYRIRLLNGEFSYKSRELLQKIEEEDFSSDDGYGLSIKYGYFFNTNTICCKREVFDKVGLFKAGVKNGEDDDMWFRIFAYYSVAVSKETTTTYDRMNCGATNIRVNNSDQAFLNRVEKILSSPEVPQKRKENLLIWAEKNKLSKVRNYILAGRKKEAALLLKTIDYNKVNKKKYLVTLVCLIIPSKLTKAYVDRRDAAYFGAKGE